MHEASEKGVDVALYDLEYGTRTLDVDFYVSRCVEARGPVLELGCGSGRLTLPIARSGITIDGIDADLGMLRALWERVDADPEKYALLCRIATKGGPFDSQAVSARVYGLVLAPFNFFAYLLDFRSVLLVLRAARNALREDGRLIFDVSISHFDLALSHPPSEHYAFRYAEVSSEMCDVALPTWEEATWDAVSQVRHVRYVYEWPVEGEEREKRIANGEDLFPSEGAIGRQKALEFVLKLRTLSEWKVLLDLAGFSLVEVFGGFSGEVFDGTGHRLVVVAKPKMRFGCSEQEEREGEEG
jgi:SAM-dependent methyltransferase